MSAKAMQPPVTHVIFDVDGLLLDTERLYTEATQHVLDRYQRQFTWQLKQQMMGRSAREAASFIIDQLQLPVSADEYMQLSQQEGERLFATAQLMPGAERLVRHLYDNKVPMAVASGMSEEAFQLKTGQHRALFSLFSHRVLASSDVAVRRGKPHPDVFLVAAARFSSPPRHNSHVLVLEDAPGGVQAALSADMQCVLVPDARLDVSHLLDTYGGSGGCLSVLDSLLDFQPQHFSLPAFGDDV